MTTLLLISTYASQSVFVNKTAHKSYEHIAKNVIVLELRNQRATQQNTDNSKIT